MSVLKREINNMSILRVGCLQLNLQKTDNLDYVVHAIKNFYNDNSSIDLIVISELAVGGAGAKNTNHSLEIHLDTFLTIVLFPSIKYGLIFFTELIFWFV